MVVIASDLKQYQQVVVTHRIIQGFCRNILTPTLTRGLLGDHLMEVITITTTIITIIITIIISLQQQKYEVGRLFIYALIDNLFFQDVIIKNK